MRVKQKQIVWATLSILILVASFAFGYRSLTYQALNELGVESQNRLTLFASNLDGILAKYEHLPKLIASHPYLTRVFKNPSPAQLDQANRFLESVADISGALDAYLIDHNGVAIAASNWNLERSFIGLDLSFRPYFKEAIKGEPGRYFALGSSSLQRGYYYSYPVTTNDKISGVVVIKVSLADIESAWTTRGNHFIVTDSDGIVFLTTNPDWTYRAIREIEPSRLAAIQASRRYTNQQIRPITFRQVETLDASITRVVIGNNPNVTRDNHLHFQKQMPEAGWRVHILTSTSTIRDTVLLRAALAGFALLIVLLLVTLYLVNRQRRLALQDSTELLEQRVQKRTLALENEVEERKKAEQNLHDTQAELIQAAKLAGLGQMSASISHELNQPLTAIRNYAENAQRMLERNQADGASGNLAEIGVLTQRMADIISQLRGFSRKSSGKRSRVSIDEVVNQALGMFQREIASNHIGLQTRIDPELSIVTDPLLLNQVLVNLFSNAIQAMAEVESRHLDIDAYSDNLGIVISVNDSGPGIAPNVIENVFDPFFTTKEVGLGLGLGLSISYRIMESLGGKIEAANSATGGARFELYLNPCS